MAAADAILIPIAAEYLAAKGANQLANTLVAMEQIAGKRIPRRYLVTRYVTQRRLSGDIIEQNERTLRQRSVPETRISENVAITESAGFHQDILPCPKKQGAKDYAVLLKS